MTSEPGIKEVRLGLVCYGGVSLAVYMHGLTKEIFKLVRAARAFERAYADGSTAAGLGPGADALHYDSEPAYFAALAALAGDGQPLTVAVDVVSGTSAGGINGICLARALAGGRTLDSIRDLWLNDGDIEVLLAGHALFPWGKGKVWSKLAESVARLAWHHDDAVLDGDLMCRLLYRALDGMEQVEEPLVREGESLALFVTATSVHGYQTVIPTGAGGISHADRSYRQLLHFAEQADFGDVPALTFAARATASFPGAFAPASITSVLDAVGHGEPADLERVARHFVYGSGYGAGPAARQWFMDGGVLDNGPFDHVIDAIAAKRADGQTAREIINLEPAPDAPLTADPDEPSFVGTVRAARHTIPSHTSMAVVLDQLEDMNTAIAEVGAVVATLQPAVLAELYEAVPVLLRGVAPYSRVAEESVQLRSTARELAGELGYGTYIRLRAQALAESFGAAITAELGFPAQSNRSSFVTAVLSAWVRQQPAWTDAYTNRLEEQLVPVDIPFRLRRAEFVLQGINELFTHQDEADLVPVKQACWSLLTDLRAKQQRVGAVVRDEASTLFGPQALGAAGDLASPDSFARERATELSRLYQACLRAVTQAGVQGSSAELWSALAGRSQGWDADVRAQLLARYAGFEVWDSLIFPFVTVGRLPQLTPITVRRFSPFDATCLKAVDIDGKPKAGAPSAKLYGPQDDYFGAFFERAWRENDYLWGRLDGAELILRLLSRQAGTGTDLTGPLRSALNSILDAERAELSHIEPVWRALKQQVAELPPEYLPGAPG